MSTTIPSKWVRDEHRVKVTELTIEHSFFSSMSCLIDFRHATEGLTKTELAERLGKDKGSVTKLTTAPTNMKVRTIARIADALDAHAVLLFVAYENASLVFTSTGIRNCAAMQVEHIDMAGREHRFSRISAGRSLNWIEQRDEFVDA